MVNLRYMLIFLYSISSFFVVCLDDCWQVSRDANGTIQEDPKAFPSGIRALIDYVHSRKLKFGLYSGKLYDFNKESLVVFTSCFILPLRRWIQDLWWSTWFVGLREKRR